MIYSAWYCPTLGKRPLASRGAFRNTASHARGLEFVVYRFRAWEPNPQAEIPFADKEDQAVALIMPRPRH